MKNGPLLHFSLLCAGLVFLSSCSVPGTSPTSTLGSIHGQARYLNAAGSAGIVISAERLDGSRTASVAASISAHALVRKAVTAATTTAADGSYALNDLEQGEYTVYASSQATKEKAVATNVKVEAGRSVTPADLLLTETGAISGTVLVSACATDNAGTVVFVAGTSFMAMTDSTGAFTIADVPVGTSGNLSIVKDSYSHAPISVTVASSSLTAVGTIDATLDFPWSSGHGSPSEAAGADGKLYINVSTGAVFRKSGGAWRHAAGSTAGLTSPATWLGVLSRHPSDPPLNGTYYDSSIGIVYLWDGGSWKILWKDVPPATIRLHRELLASNQADFALVGLGWDPGDPGLVQYPPDNGPGVGAPGFGTSSFFSNVQGSQAGHDGPRYYTALRIRPQAVLGLATVTLGDIASISYQTRQQNASKPMAWQLKIYTEPPGGPVYPRWYGHRVNSIVPPFSDIDWHTNSTASLVCDRVTSKDVEGIETSLSAGGLTMGQVLNAAAYGSESILWIDIVAGWATAGPEVNSYLDGVTITLKQGGTIVLDLGD
jgi:hypothetical protein